MGRHLGLLMERDVKAEFVKDYVVYQGQAFKGTDAVGKLCRFLDSDGRLDIYRDGKPALSILDIRKRALVSLRENDKGFGWGKYVPFSASGFAPHAV